MKDEIERIARRYNAWLSHREGMLIFEATIGEKRVNLTTNKLVYTAKIKIDDSAKKAEFYETLEEDESGPSTEANLGTFSGEAQSQPNLDAFAGAKEGAIEERSAYYSKEYQFKFDYKEVSTEVEKIVKGYGYSFEHRLFPM